MFDGQSINIEEEMKSAFLDYSMSVIVSRALPDVCDGLKPVHRRILYAMHLLRNTYNRPYNKSARVVGEVIGRFHPHGDSAVYDALVRLAQDFSMRYTVVDGQGNFGSIDGDSAAAMRYTEVRMQRIADSIMADIDKETVDFVPNYDNKELEPTVLPTKLPMLLVNGTSGIAVGMATNIPPHNLNEIADALVLLLETDKASSLEEIMEIVQGPDFPTAGMVYGLSGIHSAYRTGRGSVVMRARTEIEENSNGKESIVLTEIPYQVNKSKLIEKIADLVREKKIEGISDIRDESTDVVRVVIDLKRGESSDILLNNLYKLTPMQCTFGVNMVALVGGIPRLLNIKQVLEHFLDHRRTVILRRTAFELRKAEERAHILLGLKVAVENADDVIAVIRGASDSQSAQAELIRLYSLTEIQAKAILDMKLARLTGLERERIVQEYSDLMETIVDLKDILAKSERVKGIIREEIAALKEEYGDGRKTEILAVAADEFSMESLVADDEVAVTITHAGYIKRTPLTEIVAQRRGGKGKVGMTTKQEDFVKDLFLATNHQSLLCFTNLGRVYAIKVYQTPESTMRGRGKHFANLLKLGEGEYVVSVLPLRDFSEGHFIVSVTRKGFIKKTDLRAFSNLRVTGIIALKLDNDDSLVACRISKGDSDILIATKLGKAIRFPETDLRAMGRSARGVTGIRFSEDDDQVIALTTINGNEPLLSVCENGYGKRTSVDDYRIQSRAGKGIYTIKVTERNGPVVDLIQVAETDDLMVMTSSGKVMRFSVSEVAVIGRLTQGVKLMNVDKDEKIISLARIPEIDGQELSS